MFKRSKQTQDDLLLLAALLKAHFGDFPLLLTGVEEGEQATPLDAYACQNDIWKAVLPVVWGHYGPIAA